VVILIIIICSLFVCQGLIVSKALKAQRDREDESSQKAIGNLRSEVITLRNEALEKDKILLSLVERLKSSEVRLSSLSEAEQRMKKAEERQLKDVKRIADLEYVLSTQVELHRTKVQERLRVQKNIEELSQTKEECYNVAKECDNNLKNSFTKVGAFSSDQNFICGDPDGVIRWINGEAEAFEEILSDRGTSALLSAPMGPCQSLKRSTTNMPRLWFS
jgi:valyl-tRNA synthetase